ncbi:hypothetical protein HPB47_026742 [Ixodes persulcatus]|uniref:Uncharacterized protein n=1 Tax=Ixodes persulcatus TaxID=34615 RepID=A0AC60PZT4_IXOPE|nr:hypothetical protein HPB47_026742 [Ixodes persulcatus]
MQRECSSGAAGGIAASAAASHSPSPHRNTNKMPCVSQELADMEDKPRVCTLVAKHIPIIVDTQQDDRGPFLLNVYNPPSRPQHVFDDLFRDTIRTARGMTDDLVMVCDFNATHLALGYAKATIKGRRLMGAINVPRLTLLNNPDQPTRMAPLQVEDPSTRSTSADSNEDGAVNVMHSPDDNYDCTWTNLGESLGPGHLFLGTKVPVALNLCELGHVPIDPHYYTNRDQRRRCAQSVGPTATDRRRRATKKTYATDKVPIIDPPPSAFLRGTPRSHEERIPNNTPKSQSKPIGAHSVTSCRALLLRTLLDPSTSRIKSSKAITKLLRYLLKNATGDQVWMTLGDRYVAVGPRPAYAPYPHEEGNIPHPLDSDFTKQGVRNALQNILRSTSPDKYGVTYRLQKNLDDGSITARGDITRLLITGEPLSLQNLRPISLTSCICKLMKLEVLRRLQPHLESTGFFAGSMFDFRPDLSTRDVLLQLKEDVLDTPVRRRHGRCWLLTLRALLTTLVLGDQPSDLILLTGRGLPQGSVLSPTLFNIAMAGLSKILSAIPRIHHVLYADDITVWIENGSDGEVQDALLEAKEATQLYARAAGLSCSVDKSELILIGAARTKVNEKIEVSIEGLPNPQLEDRLRILQLHRAWRETYTVHVLRRQCRQIAHLIRRVSNKRWGFKESDTLRIVQALLISRVAYHAPFPNFHHREVEALDATLRTAVKRAVGFPQHVSTEHFLQLGLHNMVQLIDAQHTG